MTVVDRWRPETAAGGFTRDDEDIAFYTHVNALVSPDMVVVDLGAGRGSRFDDGSAPFRKSFCNFQGRVKKVIGLDVDAVVMKHPHLDEAHVIEAGGNLPLADSSVDVIFCEWVIEHVEHPKEFAREVQRVLKPGGWFCALTPNRFGYVGISNRIVPEAFKDRLMRRVWPERPQEDVFPTFYRMNTWAASGAHWAKNAGRTTATLPTVHQDITGGRQSGLPLSRFCNGPCRPLCAPISLCSLKSGRSRRVRTLFRWTLFGEAHSSLTNDAILRLDVRR